MLSTFDIPPGDPRSSSSGCSGGRSSTMASSSSRRRQQQHPPSVRADLLDVPDDDDGGTARGRMSGKGGGSSRRVQRRGSWAIDMPRLEGDDETEADNDPPDATASRSKERRLTPPSPSRVEDRPSLQRHRSTRTDEAEVAAGGERSRGDGRRGRMSSSSAGSIDSTEHRSASSMDVSTLPTLPSGGGTNKESSRDLYENARKNLFGGAPTLTSSVASGGGDGESTTSRDSVEVPAWMYERVREQARKSRMENSRRNSYHSAGSHDIEERLVNTNDDDDDRHDYDASGAQIWASTTSRSIMSLPIGSGKNKGAVADGRGRSRVRTSRRGPSRTEEEPEIGDKVQVAVDFEEVEFFPRRHKPSASSSSDKHKNTDENGTSDTSDSTLGYEDSTSNFGSDAYLIRPKGFNPCCYYVPQRTWSFCKLGLVLALALVFLSVTVSLLFQSSGSAILSSASSLEQLTLPSYIEANLANWSEFPVVDEEEQTTPDLGGSTNTTGIPSLRHVANDVPLFWMVPLSGTTVMEEIFGACLRLVQASEVGIVDDHDADPELRTVDVNSLTYLNVDTTTSTGLERAKKLELASSGLPDVISTSLLHDAASILFDPSNRGRVLTILRHPVDRAMATYHYLVQGKFKGPDGEDLDLASKSLEEYADSDFVDDNWMVRTLVNKPDQTQRLGDDDLELAKAILHRKALVGVYSDLLGAVDLFVKYFDWDVSSWLIGSGMECANGLIEDHFQKEQEGYPEMSTWSDAYKKIMAKNEYDIQLYKYAVTLHKYQASQNGR